MYRLDRAVLIVLDGCGVGEMPDAADWGDEGCDTIGNVLANARPRLPNLQRLGLGNIRTIAHLPAVPRPAASFGKAAIRSNGKDTITGHWEITGLISPVRFPTYPYGFPPRILEPFTQAIGRQVLGNKPASGTEILKELGEEHVGTGKPIVYTSADSVFQIAAHEQVIPLEELYGICRIARDLLDGPDRVGRVIARPFVGSRGSFRRTPGRKDFAVPPPEATLLDRLLMRNIRVAGIGKIAAIFDYRGIAESSHTRNNGETMDQTILALQRKSSGLVFANFVDFDALWGHRRDVEGYARGLEAFDQRLPELLDALEEKDALIITADHGCDPASPGTDHTREYVPILVYSRQLNGGVNLGARSTMADIGQTIAENFGLCLPNGSSFLRELN